MNLVCWKCKQQGALYKVKNSWVFACETHKELDVPMDASSERKNEDTNSYQTSPRV
jgi:hypothetical protein